jgi:thiol-disulfide isomerase/thioredoxin
MNIMQKGLILTLILFVVANVSLSAQTAPNFTFTDTEGVTHDLYADYLNQGKTVLLKIFFVNCPPCRAIAPSMQTLYEEWGEGEYDVEFIELSNKSFDSNLDVQGYKNDFNITFPGAGADGGALIALEPYLTGTFGSFFGTPEFAIISPNRSVNYGVGGGSVANTIAALDQAIADTGAQKPGGEVLPSTIQIQVEDFFGNVIQGSELVLGSASSSQEFPLSLNNGIVVFENFEEDYPGLNDPVIRIRKTDDARDKLSALDILILVRHILNLVPISNPDLLLAADVTGDSATNAIDLLTLQRVILGLLSEFPNVESYQFPVNDVSVDVIPGETQIIQFIGVKTGDLNGF